MVKYDPKSPQIQEILSSRDGGPYRRWIDIHKVVAARGISDALNAIDELGSAAGSARAEALVAPCLKTIYATDCFPVRKADECVDQLALAKIPGMTADRADKIRTGLRTYLTSFGRATWARGACVHNGLTQCPPQSEIDSFVGIVNTTSDCLKQGDDASCDRMDCQLGQAAACRRIAGAGPGAAPRSQGGGTPSAGGASDGGSPAGKPGGAKTGVAGGDARSPQAPGEPVGRGRGQTAGGLQRDKPSPQAFLAKSIYSEPPPKPADCPEMSAAEGGCPVKGGAPGLPSGVNELANVADHVLGGLRLKAAKAILSAQVMAYLRQSVVSSATEADFVTKLEQAVKACGKDILDSKDAAKNELQALVVSLTGDARRAWKDGKPDPETVKRLHRETASVAARRVAALARDLGTLRKDFDEPPPELANVWPKVLSFQTAVKILDATTVGFRERWGTDNSDRPCGAVKGFGWGGPWVGAVYEQPADERFSAADQTLLTDHLKTPEGERVATNPMQRCKIKASLMERKVQEMGQLLAKFPELGETMDKEGKRFAYQDVAAAAEGGKDASPEIDQVLRAANQKDGAMARMRGSIQQLCADPDAAADVVFADDRYLANFLSCGAGNPVPTTGAGLTPADQAEIEKACREIKTQSGAVCFLKNRARLKQGLKGIAVQTAMTGLDIWGSFGAGGLVKAAVQRTLLADLAASFTRKHLAGLAVGTAVGGGIGFYGVQQAEDDAQAATAKYYAGFAPLDAYRGALHGADDARKHLLRDTLLGAVVGHTMGAPGSRGAAGEAGAAYRKFLLAGEGERAGARAGFLQKMRASVAADLGLTPARLAALTDEDLLAIAAINHEAGLSPRASAVQAALQACKGEPACQDRVLEKEVFGELETKPSPPPPPPSSTIPAPLPAAAATAVADQLEKEAHGHFYRVNSGRNPHLYAQGALSESGTLSLEFRTKLPDGQRSPVLRGADEFRSILDHFGGRVKRIEGAWSAGGGVDNLEAFNQAVLAGKTPEEAALATWTGQQASQAGFGKVRVGQAVRGADGRYVSVVVDFERDLVNASGERPTLRPPSQGKPTLMPAPPSDDAPVTMRPPKAAPIARDVPTVRPPAPAVDPQGVSTVPPPARRGTTGPQALVGSDASLPRPGRLPTFEDLPPVSRRNTHVAQRPNPTGEANWAGRAPPKPTSSIPPPPNFGKVSYSKENPWGDVSRPAYRHNVVIDNRDVTIRGPEINYRTLAGGKLLDQFMKDELGAVPLAGAGKGAQKVVFVDAKDPSILRKAMDSRNFRDAHDLAGAVQREVANHLLMEARGLPVAQLDTSPAARALWNRGVITYKRSAGRPANEVFGTGGYRPGRFPRLDGLLDDVERMKVAVMRNTGDQHGKVYLNKVPVLPRNGVEVKPVRFEVNGKPVDGFLDPATGKKMTAGELQPFHYSVVSENGLTLYNTPMGIDVGYNLSNIFIDEATGHVELIDN